MEAREDAGRQQREYQLPRLLVCSHRGPVSFRRGADGLVAVPAGPGGLVPLVAPVLERSGGTWIYAPASDADREMARSEPAGRERRGVRWQMLDLPVRAHRRHYEVISAEYLGRLFHYLFPLGTAPVFGRRFTEAWQSYRDINGLYADAVLRRADACPILIEDYHLMLVAAALRASRPSLHTPLLYFHHVPWCEPDYFAVLPSTIRTEVLHGLLAYDVVAFHSVRWKRAFLACCERFLPGALCSLNRVEFRGQPTRVVVAPGAIDAHRVTELAHAAATEDWLERLQHARAGRKTLVRVDRADLWKNALRGFLAFEYLLQLQPELASGVWFLALMTPTRTWLPEYRRYLRTCQQVVARINARFGHLAQPADGPITLLLAEDAHQPDYARALAGMRLADVLLVNPIFDGLNLVAKEGPIVSANGAALVLSRNAGAYDELSGAAIGINPFDLIETANAIQQGLAMSEHERCQHAESLRAIVSARGPEDWVRARLDAVDS